MTMCDGDLCEVWVRRRDDCCLLTGLLAVFEYEVQGNVVTRVSTVSAQLPIPLVARRVSCHL